MTARFTRALYLRPQHSPIKACATCHRPWPCEAELDRMKREREVAERVRIAHEAALNAALMKPRSL